MSNFFNNEVMILFNALSASTDDYIFISDFVSGETIWSDSTVRDFGMPSKCASSDVESLWRSRIHPDDVDEYTRDIEKLLNNEKDYHICDYRIKNKHGEYIWVQCRGNMSRTSDGKPYVFIGIVAALGKGERVDFRTGLLSSYEFNRHMLDEINNGKLAGGIMDITIADIVALNSVYSYKTGNRLISLLADVISLLVPPKCAVYRGGNHFVIYDRKAESADFERLFENINSDYKRILKSDDELNVSGVHLHSGAVMVDDISASDFDELYQQMLHCTEYARENSITDRPVFFSENSYNLAKENKRLVSELNRCVNNNIGSFCLYYQPIINPETNELRSAEALLRWNNPLSKQVSIEEMVKSLEKTGLIVPLGRHIIRLALSQLAEWKKSLPDMHININIAVPQIYDYGLPLFIQDEIAKNNLSPGDVIFEITETYEIKNYNDVKKFVNTISEMGCEIALDDFGTGNASLNSLKMLPVDWVKVDQNFVLQIAQNKVDENILKHLTELCRSLDIKLCVEGVGSLESLEVVQKYFPDTVQGYHFSTPLPANEFSEFLKSYIK